MREALVCLAFVFIPTTSIAATSAEILNRQLIKVAQVQATQDAAHADIPFAGDSIIHRARVRAFASDGVNRGSAGATGYEVCQMVRNVPEFQQARAAVIHFGTNDATEILQALAAGEDLAVLLRRFGNTVNCVLNYVTIPIVWGGIHLTGVAKKNPVIAQMNALIMARCIARERLCVFVQSPLDRGTGQFQADLYGDATHPNAAGYALWAPGLRAGLAEAGVAP